MVKAVVAPMEPLVVSPMWATSTSAPAFGEKKLNDPTHTFVILKSNYLIYFIVLKKQRYFTLAI